MTERRNLAVVGIGELLWDELPGGRRLGGAPANFATTASRLGAHGIVASRLGDDDAGRDAREELGRGPADLRFLQEDSERPTGTVSVTITGGQPSYQIHAPVAWDALELSDAWRELAGRADAVCFGTLAQRDRRSEETIHAFLALTRRECLRIFDVNLREPFFTAEVVSRSLRHATLLKLNDEEMPRLLSLASLPAGRAVEGKDTDARAEVLAEDARRILDAYTPLEAVAITLGAHGSLLVERRGTVRHRGVSVTVADTVGAGDAFTAALCVYRLLGRTPEVQSEAANRWGAWVASQHGGTPELPAETFQAIEASIEDRAAGHTTDAN